ncbi:alpha/beta fold hydrolase [Chitinophaga nivalis]|uniref:Alpha/beta hydrolase n=1 Tax=Chitinophaga nivalis TaxID=2991709 RepID=A0ABT3IPX6_9BACT|nr:alpha/beta hydrolase [Chitinophaga nivalis]MCW3464510.1 alpha/beta hydrolase [Chitinophaga nivalis]MCW3485799.1 alpha/beta hydrolase [Chitinophaga nivalis]
MKSIFVVVLLCLFCYQLPAQHLYSRAFGNPRHTPVIFIHGGPRGNSVLFEATTAAQLADKGFYVIVYDRRGEGRSSYENATLTYQEAFDDLHRIYQQYQLQRANLIGFSFGGLVTTLFAAKYPEKIQSIILTSALFSQQETYDHILDSVQQIYQQRHDTLELNNVALVKKSDRNTASYRSACFTLAGKNGFFKVPQPDAAARHLYQAYDTSSWRKQDIRHDEAPALFYQHEKRNNINVKPPLISLVRRHIPVYALYGKQDGIFSSKMIIDLKNIVGAKNFRYLDNCSHYLFADQQALFLQYMQQFLQ